MICGPARGVTHTMNPGGPPPTAHTDLDPNCLRFSPRRFFHQATEPRYLPSQEIPAAVMSQLAPNGSRASAGDRRERDYGGSSARSDVDCVLARGVDEVDRQDFEIPGQHELTFQGAWTWRR